MNKEFYHRCKNWKDANFTSLRYKDGKWAFFCSEAHRITKWGGESCPYCGIKLIKLLNKNENSN